MHGTYVDLLVNYIDFNKINCQSKKNTVPPWLPRILYQMGLEISVGDGGIMLADQTSNWKRIENDKLPAMYCLGRTWEVVVRQEYVQGIKRALQSLTNYHLRNIQLPPTLHRFHRLYWKDTCFHATSVRRNDINIIICCS